MFVTELFGKKKPEPEKPRNFVAKNAKMGGAGAHKDKKKADKQGDVKHKKDLAADLAESNRDYDQGFASPSAPALGDKAGFKRAELQHELGHEQNNIAIAINGRTWKVIPGKGYADSKEEWSYLNNMKSWADKKSASSGKKWTVHLTGAPVTVDEAKLATQDKENRFKAIKQRDQQQDRITHQAMNNVSDEVAEGMPLGKVLSFPNLVGQVKHILDAKHGSIGWKMSKRDDDVFLFSAMNDYSVRSMLVVAKDRDGWVSATNGMVDPHGKVEMFDKQELPMTLASASEIADEAIQTYHDIDLSDYADDEQGMAEGVDIGQEWMSDTELDQYVPERLQQQWRELLGYDENGNPSALWANLTGGYEPDVNDPQHRALMVKVANKWFSAKKIPNVKFFDVKDADDELEWLVQIGQQGVAEGKKPDNYHIVNKDGKPASLASYADKESASKDRDAKHPGAEVRQVGPRGKVKGVSEAHDINEEIEIRIIEMRMNGYEL